MNAPIITLMPDAPGRGDGGVQFDIDATAFAAAFAALVAEINVSTGFMNSKAIEVLALAAVANLPSMTGHGLKILQVDAGEAAVNFIALATAAQIRANAPGGLFTVDQAYAALDDVTLPSAAAIACDLASGTDFKITLAQNATIDFTNLVVKKKGVIAVTQDATGSRTLAGQVNTGAGVIRGSMPILSAPPGAIDLVGYWVKSSTEVYIWMIEDNV